MDTFTIGITYTKTTSTLTATALRPTTPPVVQTPPAGTTPAAAPSGPGGTNIWLLALMIVIGAALGGAWVFVVSRKRRGKG